MCVCHQRQSNNMFYKIYDVKNERVKGLLRVIGFTQGKTDGETDEYIGKQRRSLSTSIRTQH